MIDVLLMAVVPLIMVWGMARLRRMTLMAMSYVGVLCVLWALFYVSVTRFGLLISVSYPAVAATIGYLLFQTFHVLVTQRHSRYLRQAFSTYVSESLVDTLIKNPDSFKMSGEKKVISVLFSDIRGFTSMSEKLSPERLVTILNRYLGPMTEIVMDEEGTLDKYIGDAIMAIYNAPLNVQNHAVKAVRSAVRMLKDLEVLNQELEKEFGVRLKIGVGVHTGEAVVGNMGSIRRFDYTAIGDTVNLASRLESRTKAYGVEIIISEDTCRELKEWFLVRKLDRIRVKGKKEPVEIYQVMADVAAGQVDGNTHRQRMPGRPDTIDATDVAGQSALKKLADVNDIIDSYYQALELYFAGNFKEALHAFEDILNRHPDDVPSLLLANRCRQYVANPPPEGWDGVYVARSK